MAGRSNKKKNFNSQTIWKAGGYNRRSFDDLKTIESNTITNQKELIKNFINNSSNIVLSNFYVDDGYSGTTFDRPSFKEMMKDIMSGKINTIIVKDLSRFGRNYIEVGKYIENIFPIYNVRFISINDNIDSFSDPESVSSLLVPITNLLNDEYAKDISKKVKSAYQIMAENGKFVSGTPPYGYSLDKNDKHHLVINKEESENVHLIFQMILNGTGKPTICKFLNDNKIYCRKEMQRRRKYKISEINDVRYFWSVSTIGRIIRNEVYIGNLEQNKTTSISYKIHKSVNVPKEKWVRSYNTHEAIIDKEMFIQANKIINCRKYEKRKQPSLTIYKGKIRCGNCGRAMCKVEDTRGNRKTSNYYCMTNRQISSDCSPHKIRTSILNKMVLKTIKLQIKLVIQLDKAIDSLGNSKYNKLDEEYELQIKQIENSIEQLNLNKQEYYEKWKLDKITKELFFEHSKMINNNIANYNNEIKTLRLAKINNIKKIKKENNWIEHFKRNKNLNSLNKQIIDELVDCIYIYEEENIKIVFHYYDEFIKLTNLVLYEKENKA